MPFALAWEAFKAFGIWRKLAGVFGAAFRWVMASTTHLLIVALVAVAAWGWLGWHGKAKAEKVAASTNIMWARTNETNLASVHRLIDALNDWSAYTRAWSATALARQHAAQNALRAATERGKRMDALAGRIDAARADSKSGGPCKTPQVIVDGRGKL